MATVEGGSSGLSTLHTALIVVGGGLVVGGTAMLIVLATRRAARIADNSPEKAVDKKLYVCVND